MVLEGSHYCVQLVMWAQPVFFPRRVLTWDWKNHQVTVASIFWQTKWNFVTFSGAVFGNGFLETPFGLDCISEHWDWRARFSHPSYLYFFHLGTIKLTFHVHMKWTPLKIINRLFNGSIIQIFLVGFPLVELSSILSIDFVLFQVAFICSAVSMKRWRLLPDGIF